MRLYAFFALSAITGSLPAQVTYERMLHADQEPQNWLTYSAGYSSLRYSGLAQVNRNNVWDLQLQWVYPFQTSVKKVENTPLVVDGVLYTGAVDEVDAIDAVTGRTYWTFRHAIDPRGVYEEPYMKGVAVYGNTVFWATLDGHLIAIDAKNGQPIRDEVIAVWQKG